MIFLTRRYRFAASHRLHLRHLTDAENCALFGKCNNPFGHGHDYTLSVTITGDVDPKTGLLMSIHQLDSLVEKHVLQAFSFRNMNLDVPDFANVVPTTENLALLIVRMLSENWPSKTPASLSAVHVQETARNSFEVDLPTQRLRPLELRPGSILQANV